VGAPVKARGVTIGRVGNIRFAPDQKMVEVRTDLDVSTLRDMGLKAERPPADVRAQLASQGLVGVRFISLDFVDPVANPPPVLTFKPSPKYIPSMTSMQKSLEDSATKALDRLAQLLDTIVRERITETIAQAVTHADEALTELEHGLQGLNREQLPGRAAKAIEDTRVAIDKINKAVQRVDGDGGVIATAQRALASFGEVGRNATVTTRDLGATLDDVRAAAASIRSLAEELERNPDMLVKGLGQPRSP
jgi:paraquat-inducible protein B